MAYSSPAVLWSRETQTHLPGGKPPTTNVEESVAEGGQVELRTDSERASPVEAVPLAMIPVPGGQNDPRDYPT